MYFHQQLRNYLSELIKKYESEYESNNRKLFYVFSVSMMYLYPLLFLISVIMYNLYFVWKIEYDFNVYIKSHENVVLFDFKSKNKDIETQTPVQVMEIEEKQQTPEAQESESSTSTESQIQLKKVYSLSSVFKNLHKKQDNELKLNE